MIEHPVSPPPPYIVPVDTVMRTKFHPPRVSSDAIPRGRLLELLNAGLDGKLTLVCASAGFGKTTLLVEWLESSERATAWLLLDERDNELAVFVHALATSIQTIFPDACKNTASLIKARQFPSPE